MLKFETIFSEDLDTTFGLIVEGALHPEWPLMPGSSFMHTHGNHKKNSTESLDWHLGLLSVVLEVEPERIKFVDVKIQAENVSISVPYKDNKVAFIGERLHVFSGYL